MFLNLSCLVFPHDKSHIVHFGKNMKETIWGAFLSELLEGHTMPMCLITGDVDFDRLF